MKKIIRLTESDLMRLVRRVINEQENHGMGALFTELEPKRVPKDYVFDLLNDKKNYIGEFKILELLSKKDSNVTIRVVNSSKNIKGVNDLKLDIKFDCLNKNGGFKVVDIDADIPPGGQTPFKSELNTIVYSPLLEKRLKESVCMRTKSSNN
jgi:hypothetical protein